jgi:pimeloyl-ACP methyl ester carboxylesterase
MTKKFSALLSLILFVALAASVDVVAASKKSGDSCVASSLRERLPAKLARAQGYIELPGFGRVYVDILPGTNSKDPVLFLGGISFDTARSDEFAHELNAKGYAIIRPDLLGQGQTLLEQIGVKSFDRGKNISFETQVAMLKALQEKLGLPQVTIAGISYGGGVAGAYARANPEKVSKVALIAPYIISSDRQYPGADLYLGAMAFNPFAQAMYDQQIKNMIRMGLNKVPEYLESHREDFYEAMFRLTKGIQPLDLRNVAPGIRAPVHILKAKADPVVLESSVNSAWNALPQSSQASIETIEGAHDLVGSKPKESAEWMAKVLGE